MRDWKCPFDVATEKLLTKLGQARCFARAGRPLSTRTTTTFGKHANDSCICVHTRICPALLQREHRELAFRLREKYAVLSRPYTRSGFVVESTDTPRSIASASSFVRALFEAESGGPSASVGEGGAGAGEQLCSDDVPIATVPVDTDWQLRPFKLCPAYLHRSKKNRTLRAQVCTGKGVWCVLALAN